MAGGMQSMDLGFPYPDDKKSTEEQLREISDYLYALLGNLKFLLSNLGTENFNDAELNSITAPVYKSLSDLSGSLLEVKATAEGASITASAADGMATQAKISADGASITASNAYGEAQRVAVAVDGFTVTNAQGQTTINGNYIQSGTIEGATLRTSNASGDAVVIEDGSIFIGARGGETSAGIRSEVGEFLIWSGWPMNAPIAIRNAYGDVNISASILRLDASGNMSINAGGTVYLGTSAASGYQIDIGAAGKTVNLNGNVFLNGVPLMGTAAPAASKE
ncbi:MAG: hypothetical protein RR235_08525 [Oscillospiraceae bacterium]